MSGPTIVNDGCWENCQESLILMNLATEDRAAGGQLEVDIRPRAVVAQRQLPDVHP